MNIFPRARVCAALAALSLAPSVGALSSVPPKAVIQGAGLALDPPELVRILSDGIPLDSRPSGDAPQRSVDFSFERWEVYRWIVAYLADERYVAAVPAIEQLIAGDLPTSLQRDLDFSLVGDPSGSSWEDWDRNRVAALASFRASCAYAIARMGHAESLDTLIKYMHDIGPLVREEFQRHPENSNSKHELLAAFALTCRAIIGLEEKSGMDTLMNALDWLPHDNPEAIVYVLRLCTNQPFGPESDLPPDRWPNEIQQWKDWWSANREIFTVDKKQIFVILWSPSPIANPVSLREHVAAAETRNFDFSGTGRGKGSATWLESNGRKHVQDLLDIVRDRSELSRVRGEALVWYAKFAGDRGFKVLRELATEDLLYRTTIETLHIQSKALALIQEHFPDRVDEVAKECIGSANSVAGNAIHILTEKPEHDDFVAANFDRLESNAKFLAIQRFRRFDPLVAAQFLFQTLKAEDFWPAMMAAQIAGDLHLLDNAPRDVQAAYDHWMQDPLLSYSVLLR